MSKQCEFCGKKPQTGNYVSHSNIKTKRVFNPNLQNVRHQFANGEVRTVSVCTRCLRSKKVERALKFQSIANYGSMDFLNKKGRLSWTAFLGLAGSVV